MTTYLVLVPVPGSHAARVIDAASGIVGRLPEWPFPERIEVYFEGNRYGSETLKSFEERVTTAAGRLRENYPTMGCGTFRLLDFQVVGEFQFDENFRNRQLRIVPEKQGLLDAWCVLTPAVFKQRVPCTDCPFRKEGGVRHSTEMLVSYASYFLESPGATFPCHKSVPKTDPRDRWSKWQDGQVICAGGLLMAAKAGKQNDIVRYGVANGFYDPAVHTDEEKALVFDTLADMVLADK